MIDVVPMYEPRYYERSAQRHMARYLQDRLFINATWGLSGSLASRPEIDAVALSERRIMSIEIKAYELDASDVENIISKYGLLGFSRPIIVALAISGGLFTGVFY